MTLGCSRSRLANLHVPSVRISVFLLRSYASRIEHQPWQYGFLMCDLGNIYMPVTDELLAIRLIGLFDYGIVVDYRLRYYRCMNNGTDGQQSGTHLKWGILPFAKFYPR